MSSRLLRRLATSRRPSLHQVVNTIRSYATPSVYQAMEKDPQLADYPQLPEISNQSLPPTGWWDNQMRRNFGDPMHEKDVILSMWGPDIPKVNPSKALLHFTIYASLVGSIAYAAYKMTPESPAVPHEFPYDGLVKELGGLEANKGNPESAEDDD